MQDGEFKLRELWSAETWLLRLLYFQVVALNLGCVAFPADPASFCSGFPSAIKHVLVNYLISDSVGLTMLVWNRIAFQTFDFVTPRSQEEQEDPHLAMGLADHGDGF